MDDECSKQEFYSRLTSFRSDSIKKENFMHSWFPAKTRKKLSWLYRHIDFSSWQHYRFMCSETWIITFGNIVNITPPDAKHPACDTIREEIKKMRQQKHFISIYQLPSTFEMQNWRWETIQFRFPRRNSRNVKNQNRFQYLFSLSFPPHLIFGAMAKLVFTLIPVELGFQNF